MILIFLPVFCTQKDKSEMGQSRMVREQEEKTKTGAEEDTGSEYEIVNMTVNDAVRPMGIDGERIFFSWELESPGADTAGVFQKAYQIRLYDGTTLFWDSGIIAGEENRGVPYGGEVLSDLTEYEWEVFVYDTKNRCLGSGKDSFVTGWISREPFADAQMITMKEEEDVYYEGMPVYRKAFPAEKFAKAYLFVSGLGQADIRLNGESVTDAEFLPGWTDYHDRLLYRMIDVTEVLSRTREEGKDNILAVMAGTGWWAGRNGFGTYDYNRPALIMELALINEQGDVTLMGTDSSWEYTKDTAVRDADYFNGETFDCSFPDVSQISLGKEEGCRFCPVQISKDFSGVFTAYYGPEVKAIPEKERAPEQMTVCTEAEDNGTDFGALQVLSQNEGDFPITLKAGQTLIADLGQNITGVPLIRAKGEAGTQITVLFSEMLNDSGSRERGNDGPAGSLYRESYRSAKTQVQLILSEKEESTLYRPSLFYTGFRYLSVTASRDITLEELKGIAIGNDSPRSGMLETDNADINRLYENVLWSQDNNFFLVATDCPQRDERLGWMGDLNAFASTSMYNRDLRAFYDKWATDLLDAQTPEGAFTDTVPATVHTGSGNGGWADAGILIPYAVYRRYGRADYPEGLYPAMKKYMDYLSGISDFDPAEGRIGPGNIYGDWLSRETTDPDLLCALWYGADCDAMARMAQILGYEKDAKEYDAQKSRIRDFIKKRYLDHRDGDFSQTELIFLLHFGLYPEGENAGLSREDLEKMLATSCEKNSCRVMTGFAGTPYLLPCLCEIGRSDLAYRILMGKENPSFLYPISCDATTIWERYDSYTAEKGFADSGMNSFDHFNEGSVGAFLYEQMAGIVVDHAGEQPILIKPYLPPTEPYDAGGAEDYPRKVSGSYHSVYGTIAVSWQMETGTGAKAQVSFTVTIPAGSKACVELPIEGWEPRVLSGGTYTFEGTYEPFA
ncbi:MAG: glycoside hydrolase family 78 protein [Lachnospiraceae bacterium]|nr:glycoside hydrolase family 78 protein [Lachnospiraceae bacterium]